MAVVCKKIISTDEEDFRSLTRIFAMISTSTVLVIILMTIFIIQIFTLGGYRFDGYLEFEHLILPLFLSVLSILFYKPTAKYVKSIVYESNKEGDHPTESHNDDANVWS